MKNDASSQLWLLEETPADGRPTTALARLVGVLQAQAQEGGGRHEEELLRKAVYALTSAARGNGRVQGALAEAGGLRAMAQLLLASSTSLGGERERARRRLSLRVKLAAFGHDLAVEAQSEWCWLWLGL